MRIFAVVMAVGAATLGLAAPSLAARMAHLLVAVLAITALIAVVQPALTRWEIRRAQPFVLDDQSAPRAITPAVISNLVDEVASSDRLVAPLIRNRIGTIARGRLSDRHPAGHLAEVDTDQLEVSPELAALIAGDDSADRIPVRDLDALLTEVEHL